MVLYEITRILEQEGAEAISETQTDFTPGEYSLPTGFLVKESGERIGAKLMWASSNTEWYNLRDKFGMVDGIMLSFRADPDRLQRNGLFLELVKELRLY